MSGLFDEELGGYLKAAEPGRRERAAAWSMAIGLQAVDGLETSQFLADTAKEHIEGRITQNQARRRIRDYYEAEKESGLGETNELKSRYMLVGLTDEDKREIRRLSEKTADGHPQRLSEKAVRKSGKKKR